MDIGLICPQGWTGEYDGWDGPRAWARTRAVAQEAEALGFESIWLFDHFHTVPQPSDEPTLESFTTLAALASVTERVHLGQIVICNGFRNPALTAKMAATLDTISGGRFELGIGAGWKREEWIAYGYGFPQTRERLAMLRDSLEVVTRMLEPGMDRASFDGEHSSVHGAINLPRRREAPRLRIMVGGNGPEVTWRLAARFADELNIDGMSPDELREALPVIRSRCEEIGRDPDSLAVSLHAWWGEPAWFGAGDRRISYLAELRELGLSRVIGLLQESATSDEAVASLAEDARASGLSLAG